MGKVLDRDFTDQSNSNSAEIVSALEEMFPEVNPHELLFWIRQLIKEQHLRLRLLHQ